MPLEVEPLPWFEPLSLVGIILPPPDSFPPVPADLAGLERVALASTQQPRQLSESQSTGRAASAVPTLTSLRGRPTSSLGADTRRRICPPRPRSDREHHSNQWTTCGGHSSSRLIVRHDDRGGSSGWIRCGSRHPYGPKWLETLHRDNGDQQRCRDLGQLQQPGRHPERILPR